MAVQAAFMSNRQAETGQPHTTLMDVKRTHQQELRC